MAAVATDEEQALAEKLAEASALVDAGEYDEALDLLARVRLSSSVCGDAAALAAVHELEGRVWRSLPTRWRPDLGSLAVLVGWLVALALVLGVIVFVIYALFLDWEFGYDPMVVVFLWRFRR